MSQEADANMLALDLRRERETVADLRAQLAERGARIEALENNINSAWAKINALGGTYAPGDTAAECYNNAVSEALEILESFGAKDVARL